MDSPYPGCCCARQLSDVSKNQVYGAAKQKAMGTQRAASGGSSSDSFGIQSTPRNSHSEIITLPDNGSSVLGFPGERLLDFDGNIFAKTLWVLGIISSRKRNFYDRGYYINSFQQA